MAHETGRVVVVQRGVAAQGALEDGFGFVGRKLGRVRAEGGVVGCHGAHVLEKRPAVFEGHNKRAVIAHLDPAQLAEGAHLRAPAGALQVEQLVRAEGGQDAPLSSPRQRMAW